MRAIEDTGKDAIAYTRRSLDGIDVASGMLKNEQVDIL